MELLIGLSYFLFVGFSGDAVWRRLFGPQLGLALSVPLTLSVLVLFGSFVLSAAPRFWPVAMAAIVGLGWVGNLFRIWPRRHLGPHTRPRFGFVVIVLAGVTAVLLSSYIDAFTHLSPAQIDTYAHVENLRALKLGQNNTGYPIGHYALLQPLAFLVSDQALYRFAGPAFGVLVAFAAFRMASIFVPREWAVAVVAFLASAVFNVLSVLRASLLPSALSLVLIVGMVILLIDFTSAETRDDPGVLRSRFAAYVVLVMALGLAVPYSLVSYLFALGGFVVLALAAKWIRLGWSVALLAVTAVGPFIWPAFRVLRVILGLSNETFGSEATFSGGGILSSVTDALPAAPLVGTEAVFTNSIGAILREFLQFKYLRSPLEGVLSLGAYLLVIGAVAVLAFGWKRFSAPVKAMAGFVFAYGVALQTGFTEIIAYRGRAGWYLMMFSAFFVVLTAYEFGDVWRVPPPLQAAWRSLPALIIGLSVVSVVLLPPSGEHPTEKAFVGVAHAVDQGEYSGQDFGVVSGVRFAEQLDLLEGVGLVKSWEDVPDCPAADEIAVLDLAPDLGDAYLFEAARTGEDPAIVEQRGRDRIEEYIERERDREERLLGCGFVSVFSEDGIAVFVADDFG